MNSYSEIRNRDAPPIGRAQQDANHQQIFKYETHRKTLYLFIIFIIIYCSFFVFAFVFVFVFPLSKH